ncbi:hypothetical protein DENSPDRAFT_883039 [Dentipellis sp. KUC8613]|nr:hypothetical protein DENSPDRAFT_883039 [Dentipellis sp. KUC8613]
MSSIESESTDGEIDAEAAAAGGSSVSPDDAELYYRKYRAVQVEANTVRDERDAAIRELVAERNAHAHTTGDAHGRRQHRHHEESMPDGDERKQVELLARKFCIMYSFWLRDVDTTFKTPVDPSYDPHQRFSSAATRIQGQLADIIHVLPKEYHTRIYLRPWTHTWNMAMQQQRSNSVSRVREMAMVIFNCTADEIATSAARLTTFKEKIGFSIGRDGIGYYKLMAPIIYKDYDGKHNIKTIFLNPVLFKVSTSTNSIFTRCANKL